MKQRKDNHLITGEVMNASCLDTDGKWGYNGGRGDMPEEERKRVKEERKVVTHQKRETVGIAEQIKARAGEKQRLQIESRSGSLKSREKLS
jgi:hypothetical protein